VAEEAESIDFAGFYTATATRVVGYLYVVLGSVAEAEDAAQEAYTRAWLRWPKVRGYDDPEAWVRTVGFRIAMSSWRKTRNRLSAHRTSGADPSGAHVPEMSPDRLVVVDALRRIPAEQRRALVLFHLLGLTIAEIAEEIGAPVGTVKARLSRGRKALAPYVSEFADDEDAPPGAASSAPSSSLPSFPSSGDPAARFALLGGAGKRGMVSGA
jgi:RNA polymerase sigma-70 factor (ECF subfamily)